MVVEVWVGVRAGDVGRGGDWVGDGIDGRVGVSAHPSSSHALYIAYLHRCGGVVEVVGGRWVMSDE